MDREKLSAYTRVLVAQIGGPALIHALDQVSPRGTRRRLTRRGLARRVRRDSEAVVRVDGGTRSWSRFEKTAVQTYRFALREMRRTEGEPFWGVDLVAVVVRAASARGGEDLARGAWLLARAAREAGVLGGEQRVAWMYASRAMAWEWRLVHPDSDREEIYQAWLARCVATEGRLRDAEEGNAR